MDRQRCTEDVIVGQAVERYHTADQCVFRVHRVKYYYQRYYNESKSFDFIQFKRIDNNWAYSYVFITIVYIINVQRIFSAVFEFYVRHNTGIQELG